MYKDIHINKVGKNGLYRATLNNSNISISIKAGEDSIIKTLRSKPYYKNHNLIFYNKDGGIEKIVKPNDKT